MFSSRLKIFTVMTLNLICMSYCFIYGNELLCCDLVATMFNKMYVRIKSLSFKVFTVRLILKLPNMLIISFQGFKSCSQTVI